MVSSPIIPPEVLEAIFFRCLPTPQEARPDRKLAPLLLCHVCTTWRQIAFGQPKLWDTLHLDSALEDPKYTVRVTNALQVWAACVKTCSVSFSVNLLLPDNFNSSFQPEVDKCGSVITRNFLSPLSNQLQSLDLHMSKLSNFSPFLQSLLEFSSLQSLRVRIDSYHGEAEAKPLIAFEAAPRLHMLSLEALYDWTDYELSDFRFPWAQITHLVLGHYMLVASWLSIIRQCPNLQHCCVILGHVHFHENLTLVEHTILPDLTDFTMMFKSDAYPVVVQNLIFPSLKRLRIISLNAVSGFPPIFQPTQFYSQLSSLQTLILIQQRIPLSDLIDLLHTASLLVELELDCGFNYDSLMDSLTYSPDANNTLVPWLERLTIHVLHYTRNDAIEFSPSTYATMVSSRWSSEHYPPAQPKIACLQQVSLILDDERENVVEEIHGLLELLKEQGLSVSVSVMSPDDHLDRTCSTFPVEGWE